MDKLNSSDYGFVPALGDGRLIDLGVPKRVRRMMDGPIIQTAAIQAVDEWYIEDNHTKTILLLLGPKGTGKTIAAGHWFRLEARYPINSHRGWYTAIELMRVGLYGGALDEIKHRPFLVVDDLGNEFRDQKGSFDVVLYDILNHRYDEELPTIITGNMPWKSTGPDSPSCFHDRYDARLCDRITECGVVIACAGKSLRENSND